MALTLVKPEWGREAGLKGGKLESRSFRWPETQSEQVPAPRSEPRASELVSQPPSHRGDFSSSRGAQAPFSP